LNDEGQWLRCRVHHAAEIERLRAELKQRDLDEAACIANTGRILAAYEATVTTAHAELTAACALVAESLRWLGLFASDTRHTFEPEKLADLIDRTRVFLAPKKDAP